MRKLAFLVGLILLWGAMLGVAEEVEEKILIIDETEGFLISLRLEAMVRILAQRGFFIKAVSAFPEGPVEGAPFDLVFVIPQEGRYIWLCMPLESQVQIEEGARELENLKTLVGEIFEGRRELRTPADDLWPLLLSFRLAELGIFEDE